MAYPAPRLLLIWLSIGSWFALSYSASLLIVWAQFWPPFSSDTCLRNVGSCVFCSTPCLLFIHLHSFNVWFKICSMVGMPIDISLHTKAALVFRILFVQPLVSTVLPWCVKDRNTTGIIKKNSLKGCWQVVENTYHFQPLLPSVSRWSQRRARLWRLGEH